MDTALARALWSGPLDDPAAPARALRLDDYSPALAALRQIVGHGLPADAALRAALARWPWSVDLAWLIVEDSGDIAPLAAVVAQQDRRRATLAWALWGAGQQAAALAALDPLDPASETWAVDRAARAELAILSDGDAEPIGGPRGMRLSLLATWRRDGGAALARRLDLESAALPADPALWAFLIDAFVTERDFARAWRALVALETRCGVEHNESQIQRIRLTLDAENLWGARKRLTAQGDVAAPWLWSARRHAQHLRCLAAEIAAQKRPDYAPLMAHAAAALRLFPRNGPIRGLHRGAREAADDWDALARDLESADPAQAGGLTRLGLPDRALARLATATATGDEAASLTLRLAEAHLRAGDPHAAARALGPPPRAAPQAADHAWWAVEIALANRDIGAARAILAPALAQNPTRMGLILSAARAEFLAGDFAAAETHLARFRALKTAQLGNAPPDDLRDRITRDARDAFAQGRDAATSPGLAARTLALATPRFTPVRAQIPPRIAHYWEGPRSAPVERGIRAWARQFPQRVFDAAGARAWLDAQAPALRARFDRLTQPAARADLFRVALIAREGGLFADLDEYPRLPVAPWLEGARAVLVIEEGHGTIANNFLAAQPGLPLFARLGARIMTNLAATEAPYPWWDTGPAPLTLEALAASRDPHESPGLRFLTQPEYDARVATNLPFPHKHGPDHWR